MPKLSQPQLKAMNPASGKLVATLPADNARSVRAKYEAARAAQPAWAALPLRTRLSAIRRFRALLVAEAEALAATLTSEVGKPIAQSRNDLWSSPDILVGAEGFEPPTLAV